MNLGTPQIIFLALLLISLGIEIERHGKEKEGEHNFWVTFISTIITLSILYWGGFFS